MPHSKIPSPLPLMTAAALLLFAPLVLFSQQAMAGCLSKSSTNGTHEDGGVFSPPTLTVRNTCEKPFWVIVCSKEPNASRWQFYSEGQVNPKDSRVWTIWEDPDKRVLTMSLLWCENPREDGGKPNCATGDPCGDLSLDIGG